MYDPSTIEGQQIEVAVAGDNSEELVATLAEVDSVSPTGYADTNQARGSFTAGTADAALLVTRDSAGRLQIQALVPDEDIRSTVIVVQLQEALQTVERVERTKHADQLEFQPLEVPPEGDASPYFGFTYTVLLPLLLFLPVFISGSIAVDSISEELDRGTFELLRTAPITAVGIIDAKLLATTVLAPMQAALWITLLWANGIGIAHIGLLLAVVTALASGLVAAGIWIAMIAPERRQAQLVYSVSVLAVFVIAAVLPEHPGNTVAKLAIDTPTTMTYGLAAGYLLVGLLAVGLTRVLISRLPAERFSGR